MAVKPMYILGKCKFKRHECAPCSNYDGCGGSDYTIESSFVNCKIMKPFRLQ